eukprot:10867823-Prorocentrum_lima.AAC.1
MRKLLCKWSIMLDKRAARDARVFNAGSDVQSYYTYLNSIYEEQQRDIDTCTQEANSCEMSPQNGGLNYQ